MLEALIKCQLSSHQLFMQMVSHWSLVQAYFTRAGSNRRIAALFNVIETFKGTTRRPSSRAVAVLCPRVLVSGQQD